jgi:hypothetical protein
MDPTRSGFSQAARGRAVHLDLAGRSITFRSAAAVRMSTPPPGRRPPTPPRVPRDRRGRRPDAGLGPAGATSRRMPQSRPAIPSSRSRR